MAEESARNLDAFRMEVAAFIEAQLPATLQSRTTINGAYDPPGEEPSQEEQAARAEWRVALQSKGWLAPAWPVEYGGGGLSAAEQFVLREELIRHNAPRFFDMGLGMVGPTIIFHGTDEQKKRLIPPILSGEANWCELFSEPGAGSDLGSLQCRAVRDGDEYVVNGQKVWTSGAERADLGLLMARTDTEAPKHKGISMLVVDMHDPGVTVRTIPNLADATHKFNEVFFDNVRVPVEQRVGEENRGWYYLMTLLDTERSAISQVAAIERTLESLLELARSPEVAPLSAETRRELADRAIEVEVLRGLSQGVAAIQARGEVPSHESAVLKLFHTELSQRLASTAIKIAGTSGLLSRDAEEAPLNGQIGEYYLYASTLTIQVGTSEVQRNIIATRGLGLPRE
jgi:alkylation response protein AidB-like acyl-CoA dehydrogenase